MKKFALLVAINALTLSLLMGQPDINYYFGEDQDFDPSIPTPEEVLGFDIGEFHLSHDQLIRYFEKLDQASDRVELHYYAKSYEQRPLFYVYLSTKDNVANAEEIKKNKMNLFESSNVNKFETKSPAVIYQGYSVHGNEASGGNAAVLYAYYLAASRSQEVKDLLSNTFIMLDPCFNPDGFHRFSSWVNTHRSDQLNPDRANREFHESWPGGRTNHYWFDLNRDWLLLQHPESRGRVKTFHEWKPVILTDHHEMGTDRSFFFQPGIPSRVYPRTPNENQELTAEIGTYHEAILDSVHSLYYTQESFDDYYIGKGSTYPDVNGCIGILFEQASSRGHNQESVYGDLSFPFTIKNQLLTSISTLRAASTMGEKLNAYQKDFFQSGLSEAKKMGHKGFLVASKGDHQLFHEFLHILDQHNISYFPSGETVSIQGKKYEGGQNVFVPTDQINHRLIEGIFETRTRFQDSLFYDVSTWTLPLAYNLAYEKTSKIYSGREKIVSGNSVVTNSKYAYSFSLNNSNAYPLALDLLDQGIRVMVTNQNFEFRSKNGRVERGSFLVSLENQDLADQAIHSILNELNKKYNVNIQAVNSGAKDSGVNPGSPLHYILSTPKVALIVGPGARSYDAGEIWHLFDQRLQHKITLISTDQLRYANFDDYNTIMLVDGNYKSDLYGRINSWAGSGKKLIAMRGANNWLKAQNIISIGITNSYDRSEGNDRPYNERSSDNGARFIGGSIFNTQLDLTHPLNYGYGDDELAIFKRSTMLFDEGSNPYSTPAHFTDSPLLSGYMPSGFDENARGKPSLVVSNYKGCRVISFAENPVFRAYFRGTQRQLINAIMFGESINGGATE